MITEFLVKKTVTFICAKCGDTVSMYVPTDGTTNTRSYCCSATYAVVEMEDRISVVRMADREDDKSTMVKDAVPVPDYNRG